MFSLRGLAIDEMSSSLESLQVDDAESGFGSVESKENIHDDRSVHKSIIEESAPRGTTDLTYMNWYEDIPDDEHGLEKRVCPHLLSVATKGNRAFGSPVKERRLLKVASGYHREEQRINSISCIDALHDSAFWCDTKSGLAGQVSSKQGGLKVWTRNLEHVVSIKSWTTTELLVLESVEPSERNVYQQEKTLDRPERRGRLRIYNRKGDWKGIMSRLLDPLAFDVSVSEHGKVYVLERITMEKTFLRVVSLDGSSVKGALYGPNPGLRRKQQTEIGKVLCSCVDICCLRDSRLALLHNQGLLQIFSDNRDKPDIEVDTTMRSLVRGGISVIPPSFIRDVVGDGEDFNSLESIHILVSSSKVNERGSSVCVWIFKTLARDSNGFDMCIGDEVNGYTGPFEFAVEFPSSICVRFHEHQKYKRERYCRTLGPDGKMDILNGFWSLSFTKDGVIHSHRRDKREPNDISHTGSPKNSISTMLRLCVKNFQKEPNVRDKSTPRLDRSNTKNVKEEMFEIKAGCILVGNKYQFNIETCEVHKTVKVHQFSSRVPPKFHETKFFQKVEESIELGVDTTFLSFGGARIGKTEAMESVILQLIHQLLKTIVVVHIVVDEIPIDVNPISKSLWVSRYISCDSLKDVKRLFKFGARSMLAGSERTVSRFKVNQSTETPKSSYIIRKTSIRVGNYTLQFVDTTGQEMFDAMCIEMSSIDGSKFPTTYNTIQLSCAEEFRRLFDGMNRVVIVASVAKESSLEQTVRTLEHVELLGMVPNQLIRATPKKTISERKRLEVSPNVPLRRRVPNAPTTKRSKDSKIPPKSRRVIHVQHREWVYTIVLQVNNRDILSDKEYMSKVLLLRPGIIQTLRRTFKKYDVYNAGAIQATSIFRFIKHVLQRPEYVQCDAAVSAWKAIESKTGIGGAVLFFEDFLRYFQNLCIEEPHEAYAFLMRYNVKADVHATPTGGKSRVTRPTIVNKTSALGGNWRTKQELTEKDIRRCFEPADAEHPFWAYVKVCRKKV